MVSVISQTKETNILDFLSLLEPRFCIKHKINYTYVHTHIYITCTSTYDMKVSKLSGGMKKNNRKKGVVEKECAMQMLSIESMCFLRCLNGIHHNIKWTDRKDEETEGGDSS